jgi:phage terminase small subunit
MPTLRNPRHERFAQELAGGKTGIEAHRLAGYKPDRGNATRLQQKDSISHRVAEILAERETTHARATERAIERAAVTKEWVIGRLRENVERALQLKQVVDGHGNPTGEFRYQGTVANRALELLGKEIGMFVDRSEVKHDWEIRLSNMTRAERLEELNKILAPMEKYLIETERRGEVIEGKVEEAPADE